MARKTNCVKNGKAYFRTTLTIGRDSNGKLIRKEFYGISEKEANAKKQEYINKMNLGITNNDNKFVGNMMKEWLNTMVKPSVKPSTFARYDGIYRLYIENSVISNVKIKDINPIIIQKCYNSLAKNKKTYSQIKNLHKLLRQFFNFLNDNGYIAKNPCSGKKVTIPKDNVKKKEFTILSDKDINNIANSKDSKIKYIALISLATGMRSGEILGLRTSDIDFKNKEIHINKSVSTTYLYNDDGSKYKSTFIQDTKSLKSNRIIPLPTSLVDILRKSILLQKEEKLKCKTYSTEYKGYIFLSLQGNLMNASNLSKAWSNFLKENKIEHIKFHALRHTYATKQFEAGIPLKTVSVILGHSSIDITANIYTHVMKKEKEKTLDILSMCGF